MYTQASCAACAPVKGAGSPQVQSKTPCIAAAAAAAAEEEGGKAEGEQEEEEKLTVESCAAASPVVTVMPAQAWR